MCKGSSTGRSSEGIRWTLLVIVFYCFILCHYKGSFIGEQLFSMFTGDRTRTNELKKREKQVGYQENMFNYVDSGMLKTVTQEGCGTSFLLKQSKSQALDGEVYEVCKNLLDVHNFVSTNNLENIESQDQRKLADFFLASITNFSCVISINSLSKLSS